MGVSIPTIEFVFAGVLSRHEVEFLPRKCQYVVSGGDSVALLVGGYLEVTFGITFSTGHCGIFGVKACDWYAFDTNGGPRSLTVDGDFTLDRESGFSVGGFTTTGNEQHGCDQQE
ncbi:MAG TPA: hypothetical protein DCX79_12850 [Planctomycetaceae bacterium]|nr:hypothetical protein [Planctomycetaceae bacterium]